MHRDNRGPLNTVRIQIGNAHLNILCVSRYQLSSYTHNVKVNFGFSVSFSSSSSFFFFLEQIFVKYLTVVFN